MINQHELWRELYEAADRELNRGLRLRRIMEAQNAILEYALVLELTHRSDEECLELERAAEGLRLMKLAYESAWDIPRWFSGARTARTVWR